MRERVDEEKKARTRGISLTPDAYDRILERVESLAPFVRSFSAYFQILAEMDVRDGLIEKELLRRLEAKGVAGLPESPAAQPKTRKIRTAEGKN